MLKRKSSRYPTPAQKREREQWAERFEQCWVCGWLAARWRILETHEIASRAQAPNKWADVRNYLKTCRRCHDEVLSWLPECVQLSMKLLHDPDNYDRQFINEIRGHAPDAIAEHEVVLWTKYLKVGR